jgi:hypothetical protein
MLRLWAFADFGLYVYRWPGFYLAVRCGRFGDRYTGAHAHNDQLSLVLFCNGRPILSDPGSYLYTPLPRIRNAFRSTAAHNVMAIEGGEQNTISMARSDLFRLPDQTRSRVIQADGSGFIGEHYGFGKPLRRILRFHPEGLDGIDRYPDDKLKRVFFHLAPGQSARPLADGGGFKIESGPGWIEIRGGPGAWSSRGYNCSPEYGRVQGAASVVLTSRAPELNWRISTADGEHT